MVRKVQKGFEPRMAARKFAAGWQFSEPFPAWLVDWIATGDYEGVPSCDLEDLDRGERDALKAITAAYEAGKADGKP